MKKNGYNTPYTPSFPIGNNFNKHYGLCSFMGHGGPDGVSVATWGDNKDMILFWKNLEISPLKILVKQKNKIKFYIHRLIGINQQ